MTLVTQGALLARRNLRKQLREPGLVLFATAQPVIFLLLIDGLLRNSQATGGKYIQFLLPGVLVQMLLFGANQTGISMATDIQAGLVSRLTTTGVSGGAIVLGRLAADIVRNAVTVLVVLIVGVAVAGYRFETASPLAAVVALAVLPLLLAAGGSVMSLALALRFRRPELVQAASFLFFLPLAFISSAFVPTEATTGWIAPLVRWSAVSAFSDAARDLTNVAVGRDSWPLVAGWILVLFGVGSAACLRLFRRREW